MASALGGTKTPWRDDIEFAKLRVDNIYIGDGAPIAGLPATAFKYFDDFFSFNDVATTGDYATAGDTPDPVTSDAAGGVLEIPTSAATDNHQSIVSSITESWIFAANKKVWFETRVRIAEDAANSANLAIGLSSNVAADLIADTTGVVTTSTFDGALFSKANEAIWKFVNSNATSDTSSLTVDTAFLDDTWQILGFAFEPGDNVTGRITPYVDGKLLKSTTITLAGLEEMHICFALKNSTAAVETLKVDYVMVVQER